MVSSIVIPRYGSHCDNQAQCHVGTRLIGATLRKSHKYLTIALYTGNEHKIKLKKNHRTVKKKLRSLERKEHLLKSKAGDV